MLTGACFVCLLLALAHVEGPTFIGDVQDRTRLGQGRYEHV